MKQRTIKQPVSLKGVGLHTGQPVTLTFQPAPADHGYKFQRTDIEGKPVFNADVNRVVSTQRGTTIKFEQVQISTIEHALSALVGMQIDNVLIQLDGPEVPILDGSALPFVQALRQAGIEEQEAEREYFEITQPVTYRDESTGTELMALPCDHFEVITLIDFNSEVLGQQYAQLTDINDYEKEIAPCRTFVFLHELEVLFQQNLIRGGDLENAIVIVDRKVAQEELDALAIKMNKPGVKVSSEGVLNTVQLHFQNEPARHKLLDVIGDLALIGKPIRGKIVATKPGHTANVEFGKLLKKQFIEKRRLQGVPKYDLDKEPVYDTVQIMRLLPHRIPFLLVDKILEISEQHVVGLKNVTMNEPFFQGHFPDNPIFPGVLQMEGLAQTGGILALHNMPDSGNWDTYFLKIDNAKFKAKVVPGDTILYKMELLEPIRRGIVHMQGTAYVGNKVVSEGELTAQIVRRNKTEG